jgi:DnaJ-class molecular chaperone
MADYIDDDNLWKEDLFATLGVDKEASDAEIKKAYLKLAKKYHPDKFIEENEEKLEAQRIFSKITVAYNTLSNPDKKAHYLELRRLLANHLPENQIQQETISEVKTNNETKDQSPRSEPPKQKVDETPIADKVKEEQARSFYNKGLEEMKKKKYDMAIDSFKKAISIKNDIADFHSQLGLAYQAKNWEGMAQGEFKLALKYNSSDPIARKNLKKEDVVKKLDSKQSFFSKLFKFGKK